MQKLARLLHSIMMECGEGQLQAFRGRVRSILSDQGIGQALGGAPDVTADNLQDTMRKLLSGELNLDSNVGEVVDIHE